MCSLDRRESLELALVHVDLFATGETDGSGGTLDKADTIAVQALVDTSHTAGRACDRYTGALALDFRLELLLVALAEVLDDGGLHGKLDTIQGQEPDDVPYPDDTDPSTRDASDVGEGPVSVGGNNGRDELGDAEGDKESP